MARPTDALDANEARQTACVDQKFGLALRNVLELKPSI
jgi:hypothetical protein